MSHFHLVSGLDVNAYWHHGLLNRKLLENKIAAFGDSATIFLVSFRYPFIDMDLILVLECNIVLFLKLIKEGFCLKFRVCVHPGGADSLASIKSHELILCDLSSECLVMWRSSDGIQW